jgi:hypothetical protein
MRKRVFILLSCVLLILPLAGCYTLAVVDFGNGTATSVKVRTLQTGRELDVKPGRFKELPHASGDIVVTTQSKEIFKFSRVDPPAMDRIAPNYLRTRRNLFGPGRITLRVKLETNMELYALLPGEKNVEQAVAQPEGYPKAGNEQAK